MTIKSAILAAIGALLGVDSSNYVTTTNQPPLADSSLRLITSNWAAQIGGRYLGTTVVSATGTVTTPTFNGITPTLGRFRGVAAGGAGGGASATASGQAAAGGGGAAGSPFDFLWTNFGASFSVTIGAGGTGVAGANGNAGGNLVIGSVATIKGGAGGNNGGILGSFPGNSGAGGAPQNSTISGTGVTVLLNGYGQGGDVGVCFSSGFTTNGKGGSSPFGHGGVFGQAVALGFGAGGLGAGIGQSASAAAGNAGANGILLIDWYA